MKIAVGLAAVVMLGACRGPGSDGALSVGDRFEHAVGGSDFAAACVLLSARAVSSLHGPCPSALKDADLPSVTGRPAVVVRGTVAQLRYAGDVLFLGRFGSQWRVVAAGCQPVAGAPYDCDVDGG